MRSKQRRSERTRWHGYGRAGGSGARAPFCLNKSLVEYQATLFLLLNGGTPFRSPNSQRKRPAPRASPYRRPCVAGPTTTLLIRRCKSVAAAIKNGATPFISQQQLHRGGRRQQPQAFPCRKHARSDSPRRSRCPQLAPRGKRRRSNDPPKVGREAARPHGDGGSVLHRESSTC